MRIYTDDKKLGDEACVKFGHYLYINGVAYTPATPDQQLNGIDVVTDRATYEVKHQTMPGCIVIEEDDGLRQGWIYTCKSDYIILVGDGLFYKINVMNLRKFYEATKQNYRLYTNEQSKGERGDYWTGSFRVYGLSDFCGFFSVGKYLLEVKNEAK